MFRVYEGLPPRRSPLSVSVVSAATRSQRGGAAAGARFLRPPPPPRGKAALQQVQVDRPPLLPPPLLRMYLLSGCTTLQTLSSPYGAVGAMDATATCDVIRRMTSNLTHL